MLELRSLTEDERMLGLLTGEDYADVMTGGCSACMEWLIPFAVSQDGYF